MTVRLWVASAAAVILGACAHRQAAEEPASNLPRPLQLSWYRLPNSEFSVLMPQGMQQEEKTRPIAGGEVKVHLAQAAPPMTSQSYLVSFAEFPPDVLEKASTAQILDGVQQATVREMRGQLIDSRDITEAGMPGREFDARKQGQGILRARVLVGTDAVYTLVGTYASAEPPEPIVRFLSSFSRTGAASAVRTVPAGQDRSGVGR